MTCSFITVVCVCMCVSLSVSVVCNLRKRFTSMAAAYESSDHGAENNRQFSLAAMHSEQHTQE